MNLVADIGGSNIRLALADAAGGLSQPWHASTPDELAPLLRAYLLRAGAPALDGFACAAAGPLAADGSIALTNHPLRLDHSGLLEASGAARAWLVNDFAAIAHAVPLFGADDLRPCGGGERDPAAPCVVVGPGTGLGVALALSFGGAWQVLPGEGGHVDLAAVDAEERALWPRRSADRQRISAEWLLSGPGLQRLYRALGGESADSPAAIDEAAQHGDAAAVEARRLFTRLLGRFAGNLALTVDARGGVFIGGGIVPCWGERFDVASFRAGFEDKGTMQQRLAGIPVFVITHPFPALLGLARLAAQGADESSSATDSGSPFGANAPARHPGASRDPS